MPLITIYRKHGSLDHIYEQALSKELCLITNEHLLKKIEHTVVHYIELSSNYEGGEEINQNGLSIDIKITKGTNTEIQKSEWIKNVWEILQRYFPKISERVIYISISELENNSWGYNGLTQKKRLTMSVKNEI